MSPTQPQWRRGHEVPEVLTGGRFLRLSSLRFIPRGNKVSRVLIHLLSLTLHRQGSWLRVCSITMTDMSARLCSQLLKCAYMGDSSVLQCVMSNRWPFTLRWNGWPVSPRYCWPHLLHVINISRWRIYRRLGFWPWKISSRMAGKHDQGHQYEVTSMGGN